MYRSNNSEDVRSTVAAYNEFLRTSIDVSTADLDYDESKSQARIERKIKDAPEEWKEIQEVRPKTPNEAKLGCPNARLRTDEPLHMGDVKDWGMHVLTDTLIRVEESVRRGAK
ncbi:hypothetical protein MKW98_021191 [Papaver atlanticum]|uniref:Uncharacterized protein n=1 Tax=Papaver atlanticum TaxID=357466 RepID=A0AAD4TAA1_9MAGN|nr:hypothetical protein MKW98_021191 [Papaver atlanticum]